MDKSSNELGIVQVLAERLEKQRLPRALEMKAMVDRGELLGESDLLFLEEVFADAARLKPYLDTHPEWQDIAGRMTHLYKEITDKALENEKQAHRGM